MCSAITNAAFLYDSVLVLRYRQLNVACHDSRDEEESEGGGTEEADKAMAETTRSGEVNNGCDQRHSPGRCSYFCHAAQLAMARVKCMILSKRSEGRNDIH